MVISHASFLKSYLHPYGGRLLIIILVNDAKCNEKCLFQAVLDVMLDASTMQFRLTCMIICTSCCFSATDMQNKRKIVNGKRIK